MLLVHGDKDEIVPFSQSVDFQKALEKAGHKTELIRLEGEGHGGFSSDDSKYFLSAVGTFLWEHLGAGVGADSPPIRLAPPKK